MCMNNATIMTSTTLKHNHYSYRLWYRLVITISFNPDRSSGEAYFFLVPRQINWFTGKVVLVMFRKFLNVDKSGASSDLLFGLRYLLTLDAGWLRRRTSHRI